MSVTLTLAQMRERRAKWDKRFMGLAVQARTWCKLDGNGAVLVDALGRRFSLGYTGFPMGIEDTETRLTDDDYRRTHAAHAELNAILQASFDSAGCTLYVTNYPCLQCAITIVQARIRRVVCPPIKPGRAWTDRQLKAKELFEECGLAVEVVTWV